MTPGDFARYEIEARSLWSSPSSTLDLLSTPPGDFYDWRQLAACPGSDPEAFFPEVGGDARVIVYARRVCAGCDVRRECLEWALRHEIKHGIWGGYTEKARRKLAARAEVAA